MSISHLIKHIYNNASEDVISRGKKIHNNGYLEIIDHNPIMHSISYRVKDDNYNTWYKVKVENYNTPRGLSMRCSCPYNLSEVCRHKAAVLLHMQEKSDNGTLDGEEQRYNQFHTQLKIKSLDIKMIRPYSGEQNYQDALEIVRKSKFKIKSAANEMVTAELEEEGELFELRIRKNEERFFDTSCNCIDENNLICKHKTALLIHLINKHGINYFDTIKNYDAQKNKLLGLYGYSLNDNLKGKFEFIYKEGKPFLKVLDPTIKRLTSPLDAPVLTVAPKTNTAVTTAAPIEKHWVTKKVGIVLREQGKTYPFIDVESVQGDIDNGKMAKSTKLEKIDLTRYVSIENFDENDGILIQQLRKLSDVELNKFLNRNSPFGSMWENIVPSGDEQLPEDTRSLILDYLQPKLQRILENYGAGSPVYILPADKKYVTSNLVKIHVSDNNIVPHFKIKAIGDNLVITAHVIIEDEKIDIEQNEWNNLLLFKYENELYNWSKPEDIIAVEKFANVTIHINDWPSYAEKNIVTLSDDYQVDFDKKLVKEVQDIEPEISVQLSEKSDFLMFQPLYYYNGVLATSYDNEETNAKASDKITLVKDGYIWIIHRMRDKEHRFFQKLQSLHTNFVQPEGKRQLALKGADALKNSWFFMFMEHMKEQGITVLGFEQLRSFRFNKQKPTTQVRISSGVDWFDAKITVAFGNQSVMISDIKKALQEKRTTVQLNDGTLGILPEEWMRKYALLFKVGAGTADADKLRLTKYQFGVIDELYDQRNDEEIEIQLEEKFLRLRNFKKVEEVDIPTTLQATLRPYQQSGFHWLNFLNTTGMGGILADDMGLGKTVQALTTLAHFAEKNDGKLLALVVCPTTLLYNWENEIQKFTPHMTHFTHHGTSRTRLAEELRKYNIVLTTYGTLRSDIIMFQTLKFDYVVLDESQAIKNPTSKVAKAACLLNSEHRICMSGTPLQNNTFDLYSQMNFLNPGLLGSAEFFRNEFATPIDKFGEVENKQHLRKLLYPFILRRTKEQVAQDLPEKTEMVLFCEMDKEQRRIYDAYRNEFRQKVLGSIDNVGVERSTLTILQGLMKLRQICDSPAILNEEEKYPNISTKLDEIGRELEENISDHKVLIFSQFLGMLSLIKEKLVNLGVEHEYFDGSTSLNNRKSAIENFQNNPNCRVFLISLKAGGVGLNLTAADYVYIVDPWWNPAVEQQAIDRAHRIGQTRKIFAYRMICRDTVEDKIIQLQERKRLLAKELISDDTGFVKNLTRDDIEYLFS